MEGLAVPVRCDDAELAMIGPSVFGISLASLRTTISTLAAPSTSTTRDDAPDPPHDLPLRNPIKWLPSAVAVPPYVIATRQLLHSPGFSRPR